MVLKKLTTVMNLRTVIFKVISISVLFKDDMNGGEKTT